MKQSILILSSILCVTVSCRHEATLEITNGNFPEKTNKILVGKCATAGCHDAAGYRTAGGLRIDKWEHLLNGGNNGAAVIAYRPENSPLLQHMNNGHSSGPRRAPVMPPTGSISHEEYTEIEDWIRNGAVDDKGNIPFAAEPDTRQKIYLAHGGNGKCKLIAVIDGEKKVVMRYVPFGTNSSESAHNIRVSPDGKYVYACFISGQLIQKIDTRTDEVVGSINVGPKQWGVINISNDSRKLMVNAWESNGQILIINTETMTIDNKIDGPGLFMYPHGIISNASFDTFYVSSLYGNTLYKFTADFSFYEKISLDGQPFTHTSIPESTPDPHDLAYAPDYSKYFVTCQNTNEVRIFNAFNDTLLKALKVGDMPQHIAVSRSTDYAVVACMHEHNMNLAYMGAVYILNYKTMQVVKKIEGKFYEPHCVLIDDLNGVFYVLSKNLTSGFTAVNNSICGTKNGWYSVYDLRTFQPVKERVETEANPYFADTRFK